MNVQYRSTPTTKIILIEFSLKAQFLSTFIIKNNIEEKDENLSTSLSYHCNRGVHCPAAPIIVRTVVAATDVTN